MIWKVIFHTFLTLSSTWANSHKCSHMLLPSCWHNMPYHINILSNWHLLYIFIFSCLIKKIQISDEREIATAENVLLNKIPPPPVTPSVTPQPEIIQVRWCFQSLFRFYLFCLLELLVDLRASFQLQQDILKYFFFLSYEFPCSHFADYLGYIRRDLVKRTILLAMTSNKCKTWKRIQKRVWLWMAWWWVQISLDTFDRFVWRMTWLSNQKLTSFIYRNILIMHYRVVSYSMIDVRYA